MTAQGGFDPNAAAGVNYAFMDPAKKMATEFARKTMMFPAKFFQDFSPDPETYGESAFVYDIPGHTLRAHVTECLGTKDRVAQAVSEMLAEGLADVVSHDEAWECVGRDGVEMNLLDLATVGAHPVSFGMFLAAPNSEWFLNTVRFRSICNGTFASLAFSSCSWGGGEMPVLKGSVMPGAIILAGSAAGAFINEKEDRMSARKVQPGDAIILFRAFGPQSNGISVCRRIAGHLPDRYATRLSDGKTLGSAILTPTSPYSGALSILHQRGFTARELHYAVSITGHGWRKMMRAPQPLKYVIDEVRDPASLFELLQKRGGPEGRSLLSREMYATFCMEAGFAVFCESSSAEEVVRQCGLVGHEAWVAGHVEATPNNISELHIRPRDIVFSGEELDIR